MLPAALAMVVPVRRWFAVDACLDAGGAIDDAYRRCSTDATAAWEADSQVAVSAANRDVEAPASRRN
ncbi:hypothetical protein [Tahibacter caeni]|uniref:hypothetical protein n=1 Tax=Tahibacter caeni TaxID=1453545 RepID=UPI0021486C2C|nr:hypothetical protein [Tahibacter caeni]